MNFGIEPAHFHLLLNHFPTVAFTVALGLLICAVIGKSEEVQRASMVILFLIAVLAIPTYVSGNAAEAALHITENVYQAKISAHESAAFVALIFMEITGFLAWLGLWQARLLKHIGTWCTPVLLLSSIVTFALMANAANIGGDIRHPEIVTSWTDSPSGTPAGPLPAAAVRKFVTSRLWVWPTCETLHFIGLCLLFTVVLIVNLRMLGMAKSMSSESLYQLLPFGMVGFALNLITGMIFFVSKPDQYVVGFAFGWKMMFVLLGGLNVLYFLLSDKPWSVGKDDDAPLSVKLAAATAIVVWVGVLFWGHMLPFIGDAF